MNSVPDPVTKDTALASLVPVSPYSPRCQTCAPRGDGLHYAYNEMRIDSKSSVGGYPALLVRKLVRGLINYLYWDLETVQRILHLGPHEASGLVKALEAAGLAKGNRGKRPKTWTTTQLAQSFSSATAAKPITRKTAEKTLTQF